MSIESDEKALYDELYRRLRSVYPTFFDEWEISVEAGWIPIVAAALAELRRTRDGSGKEARGVSSKKSLVSSDSIGKYFSTNRRKHAAISSSPASIYVS